MNNLYIVSTPIGNMQDITIRAANTLLSVPYVITESTSKTSNLLNFIRENIPTVFEGTPKLISYSENEEEEKLPYVIKILAENDAALVSEAGTPLISDPGFKLIREAIKRGVNVVSIPGASSPITALTTSGLPTDKFFFAGYLPRKSGKRVEMLKKLSEIKKMLSNTLIIFESPHRLVESLKDIENVFEDIDIVVARELTKAFEEVRREKITSAIEHFEKTPPKGEFIILI